MRCGSLILLVFMLSGLAGCSNGNGNGDDRRYPEICDAIIACDAMSKDHCKSVYHPFVFSDACLQAVNDATCEDHKGSPPSYIDTCFPPCMGIDSTCQGDQITSCSQGRIKVYLCSEFCKMSGKEYTGVCGTEYNDGGSPSGQDMCFCE